MKAFTDWFNEQKFRNFSVKEFTNYFAVFRRGVKNSVPPKAKWKNIVPTLRIVDDLRDHFNAPVVILSSYRSPDYNRAIGDAAPKSYHMEFNALDIAVAGHSPSEVYAVLLDWRRCGRFKGGLGKYNTFVHIDTRGFNANW